MCQKNGKKIVIGSLVASGANVAYNEKEEVKMRRKWWHGVCVCVCYVKAQLKHSARNKHSHSSKQWLNHLHIFHFHPVSQMKYDLLQRYHNCFSCGHHAHHRVSWFKPGSSNCGLSLRRQSSWSTMNVILICLLFPRSEIRTACQYVFPSLLSFFFVYLCSPDVLCCHPVFRITLSVVEQAMTWAHIHFSLSQKAVSIVMCLCVYFFFFPP